MLCFDYEDLQWEEQKKKLIRIMCNNSIPANAHNKVVAGENAKEMKEEILQGFVSEATEQYIDRIVDATCDNYEYTHIEIDDDMTKLESDC